MANSPKHMELTPPGNFDINAFHLFGVTAQVQGGIKGFRELIKSNGGSLN